MADTPVPASEPDSPRRTRRGEERDSQIRARASELFLERGYDGVSLDDILRDAGGSKSNIYSFYGGKDGLFVAVMDEMIREIVQPLQQVDLAGLDVPTGLQRFGKTLLAVLLQDRHLAFQRLVITEALRHKQIGKDWYRNGPSATHAVLAAFLHQHQAAGTIAPHIDTARAAVLFHDMVLFDLLNRAMMAIDGGPTASEVATTIHHAVALTSAALSAPANEPPAA
jgi:AcrR family transcriptional regulator